MAARPRSAPARRPGPRALALGACAALLALIGALFAAQRVRAACGDDGGQTTTIFALGAALIDSAPACPHYPDAVLVITPAPPSAAPAPGTVTAPGGVVSAPGGSATVSLNGSGSADPDDPPSTITSYEWDVLGDGNYATGPATLAAQTYPRGRHIIRLRVTDNDMPTKLTDGTTVELNVTNTTVSASASDTSPVSRTPVTLTASATNPDGGIAKYEWDLDGDGSFTGPADASSTTSSSVSASWPSKRTVNVRVRVTDDSGARVVSAPLAIAVQNQAPIASFTASPPTIVGVPSPLTAAASSDADGTIAQYDWDLDGNGTYETPGGASSGYVHAFPAAGLQNVGLRVTDNDGATGTATVPVRVTRRPVAAIRALPNPAVAGSTVLFDATGSTALDGTLTRIDWDLDGNGSYETPTGLANAVARRYPNRGTIVVGVRVTDSYGATGAASVPVVMTEPGDGGTGGATGGSGGSGGSGGTGGGTGAGGAAGLSASLAGRPIQKLKDVRAKGLTVVCQANRAATCRVRALLPAGAAKRLGIKVRGRTPAVLGAATIRLRKAGSGSARLKVARKAAKALARRPSLAVQLRGTATDARGRSVALARVVLVRR